jgi:hypothetical protein
LRVLDKAVTMDRNHLQQTIMNAELRCHIEQGMLDMLASNGLKNVRIIETENATFLLEVAFNKKSQPYFLATARSPYEPREFSYVQTAIEKARALLSANEVTVVFKI